MELLAELSEESLRLKRHRVSKYSFRRVARAVLFNSEGKIALMHSTKFDYYKTPGGGIELKESIEEALKREVMEEVGYNIDIREPIGVVLEYRNIDRFVQLTYCFIAHTKGIKREPKFTRGEIKEGFTLKWVGLREAIKLVDPTRTSNYWGKFVAERESAILKKAKEILETGKKV